MLFYFLLSQFLVILFHLFQKRVTFTYYHFSPISMMFYSYFYSISTVVCECVYTIHTHIHTLPWIICGSFPDYLLFSFCFASTFPEGICCCLVAKLWSTLCNPMKCSTLGFPVLHYLPEFAQIYAHWVSDTIQPSYPLSPPSPPDLSLSQPQVLFPWCALCIRWPQY